MNFIQDVFGTAFEEQDNLVNVWYPAIMLLMWEWIIK